MSAPYRLVSDYIAHDAVEAFELLALAAAEGEVVGGAVVVLLRNRRYAVNLYGSAARNLTLTRGCVTVLSDRLGDLIRGRDPDETR